MAAVRMNWAPRLCWVHPSAEGKQVVRWRPEFSVSCLASAGQDGRRCANVPQRRRSGLEAECSSTGVDDNGAVFALLVMAVAAAEATVSLALVIAIIRTRQTPDLGAGTPQTTAA